jgi:hypothetical protein
MATTLRHFLVVDGSVSAHQSMFDKWIRVGIIIRSSGPEKIKTIG